MHYILLLIAALAGAHAETNGQRLADLLLKNDFKTARPFSWAQELEHLKQTDALELLAEMRRIPEVVRAADRGWRRRLMFMDHLSTKLRDEHSTFDTFRSEALAPFLKAQAAAGGSRRLIEAEAAATIALGLSDVRLLERPENHNLRLRWQRRVHLELARPGDRSGQILSKSAFARWRSEARGHLTKSLAHNARKFMAEWQGEIMLVFPKTQDGVRASEVFELSSWPIAFRLDRIGWEEWTLLRPDGATAFPVWLRSRKPVSAHLALPRLIDVDSVEDFVKAMKGDLELKKLRDALQVLRWLASLDERQTLAGLRASFDATDAAVRADVVDPKANLDFHERSENFAPYHTPELQRMVMNLHYSRFEEDPSYWAKHRLLTEGRPVATLKPGPMRRPHREGTPRKPPPPPISQTEDRAVFALAASGGKIPELYRWHTPNDRDDTWVEAKVDDGAPGPLVVSSRRSIRPKNRWVAIPTPLNRNLTALAVSTGGRPLERDSHYRLSRSVKSRGYAIELLVKSVRWIRMEATFGPAPESAALDLPAIPEARWREIAADLARSGEKRISKAMTDSPAGDARDLNALLGRNAKYTYHQEAARPNGAGSFGELTPFLNDGGVLCIQCGHASRHLLDPMLKTGYRGEPRLESRAATFLQKRGETLTMPPHGAVELHWQGELVEYLNPVPRESDERAPTREHVERAARAHRRAELVATLAPLQRALEAHSAGLTPRGLPADSPLHRFWRWANEAREGRALSSVAVAEEVNRLYLWITSDIGEDRSARAVQNYFRSLKLDLERLAITLMQIAKDSDCSRNLSEAG